jgi:uncharacterized protein
MQAYFFGDSRRRLLACFHAAEGAWPSKLMPAVLLCGPQGQEGVRAHRMMRVLAERLSRAGCDVLRFDPYGTGDSAGEEQDLDLRGWQRDVASAADELQRRSAAALEQLVRTQRIQMVQPSHPSHCLRPSRRPQVWLGFRVGASVACMAAAGAAGDRPSALVLVEPVMDGARYLDELALATVQSLEASCSIQKPAWRATLQQTPEVWHREALGFQMSSALHAQLRGLAAQNICVPADVHLCAVVPQADAAQQVRAWPWLWVHTAAEVHVQPYDFNWTAEEALNSELVPSALLELLVGVCKEQACELT